MGNPPGRSPRRRILKNPGKYVDALVDLLEDAGSIPAASTIALLPLAISGLMETYVKLFFYSAIL